jgi:hypothetical protein
MSSRYSQTNFFWGAKTVWTFLRLIIFQPPNVLLCLFYSDACKIHLPHFSEVATTSARNNGLHMLCRLDAIIQGHPKTIRKIDFNQFATVPDL